MRFPPGMVALTATTVIALTIACGDASGPKLGPPASIVLVSGDGQGTTEVGTKLGQPLTVRVSDSQGQRLSGIVVAWATASGSLSPSTSSTNTDGVATADWTVGTLVGTETATATVAGLTPITFTAITIAGPPTQIIFSRDTVQLLGIGDVFRFSARAADQFGNTVLLQTTVESADTTIVTADNFGTGAILTARASDKTTTVRATVGSIAKAATVIVLAPPCQSSASAFNLGVGDVALLTGAAASEFCVQGTPTGAEFIAVPFYSDFSGSSLRLSIFTGRTTIGVSANRVTPSRFALLQPAGVNQPKRDEVFEAQLRQRSITELTPLMGHARDAKQENAGRFNSSSALPQIGDLIKLNTNSSSGCDNPNLRTARVVAITNRAIVVSDTANPANGFTTEDYQSFGSTFDTLIYPVDTLNFGDPTDIDNNQRVILFFTRAVNELTPPNQNFFVGGFFFSRDLFPIASAGTLQGCAGSNFAEMFYLLVPDPGGIVNQNVRTTDFVKSTTVGTLAHEFQHLINASRHLYVNNNSTFEDSYLDEGLAHIAEELTFYRASGFAPGQNLNFQAIQSSQTSQSAFDNFGAANFRRFREFLTSPLITSPYASNSNITTRGAIWSFLRYSADRRGGSENDLWFQLANPPAGVHGLSNLTRSVTPDVSAWIRDWAVANYADDFATGAQPVDTYSSWNIRSMVSAVNLGGWPLATPVLDTANVTSVSITDGSAAYLRFGVSANAIGGGRITNRGAVVPAGFALSILRTK